MFHIRCLGCNYNEASMRATKKRGKRWQRCLVDEQKTLMPATAWQDRCKSTWIRHRRKKKSQAKLFKGVASNPDKTYFLAVFVLFMWGILASNKKIEISMNGCKVDRNFSWMLAMIFVVAQKTSHFKSILSSLLTCYKQFIMFHPFESIKSEEIPTFSKPERKTHGFCPMRPLDTKTRITSHQCRRFGSVLLVKIDFKAEWAELKRYLGRAFFLCSNPRVDPIRGQKTQASFQGWNPRRVCPREFCWFL